MNIGQGRKTATVDWLSYTAIGGAGDLPAAVKKYKLLPGSPMFGYNQAEYYDKVGVKRMWSTIRENMGVHVQYTGKSLMMLQADGVKLLDLMAFHGSDEWRCTRIDLALDARDYGLDVNHLIELVEVGEWSGSCRSYAAIRKDGGEGGVTLYVGARQSEQHGRIYHKGLQFDKDPNSDWIRLEMTLKGDRARSVAATLPALDDADIIPFVSGLWEEYILINDDVYRQVLTDSVPTGIKPGHVVWRNTARWFRRTVMPALSRYFEDQEDRELFEEFRDLFSRIRNRQGW